MRDPSPQVSWWSSRGTQQQPNRSGCSNQELLISAPFGCYFTKTQEPGTCWERSCSETVWERKTNRQGREMEAERRPGFLSYDRICGFRAFLRLCHSGSSCMPGASTLLLLCNYPGINYRLEGFSPRDLHCSQASIVAAKQSNANTFLVPLRKISFLLSGGFMGFLSAFGILKFYNVSRCYYI